MSVMKLNLWFHFRAGEHPHKIAEHVGPMLLTFCGLSYNEATARERGTGRQCRNCQRIAGVRKKSKP